MTKLNFSLRLSVAVVLGLGLLAGLVAYSRARHGPGGPGIEAFVPCGLVHPIQMVVGLYTRERRAPIHCTFGTPVELLDMIEREGARPDLFISPGGREMERLEQLGLVEDKDYRAFGEYDMVLIVPQKNPGAVDCLEDLAKDSVRRIALAEPTINSTGYYAKQALENLGLWEKVKGKVTFPRQAWHGVSYVTAGRVDAGFAYDSCPLRTAPGRVEEGKIKIVEKFPPDSHDPILCLVAMLKSTTRPKEGQAFIDYLLSAKIQQKLPEAGVPNVHSHGLKEADTP